MSNVALANEQVSISKACELVGMSSYFESGSKVDCPVDGARAFRVYPQTNSAYCFSCARAYRPVALVAEVRDISVDEAALVLLEAAGYVEEDVDAKLAALLADEDPPIDTSALMQALDTYCSRICPTWETTQLDDRPAAYFAECLVPLRLISTQRQAEQWLAAAKHVMARILRTA